MNVSSRLIWVDLYETYESSLISRMNLKIKIKTNKKNEFLRIKFIVLITITTTTITTIITKVIITITTAASADQAVNNNKI